MREFLKGLDIQLWNSISVVIFLVTFLAIWLIVYSSRSKESLQRAAHLPLNDETLNDTQR